VSSEVELQLVGPFTDTVGTAVSLAGAVDQLMAPQIARSLRHVRTLAARVAERRLHLASIRGTRSNYGQIEWLRLLHTRTHTHTHTFNGPLSRTTQVSRYQKGKTNLDFTEARDSEW